MNGPDLISNIGKLCRFELQALPVCETCGQERRDLTSAPVEKLGRVGGVLFAPVGSTTGVLAFYLVDYEDERLSMLASSVEILEGT